MRTLLWKLSSINVLACFGKTCIDHCCTSLTPEGHACQDLCDVWWHCRSMCHITCWELYCQHSQVRMQMTLWQIALSQIGMANCIVANWHGKLHYVCIVWVLNKHGNCIMLCKIANRSVNCVGSTNCMWWLGVANGCCKLHALYVEQIMNTKMKG